MKTCSYRLFGFVSTCTGITLQAIAQSHVSLVSLNVKSDGFKHFRADRQMQVGVNIESLTKVLKCMESKDHLLLKIDDSGVCVCVCVALLNKRLCLLVSAAKLIVPASFFNTTMSVSKPNLTVMPCSRCFVHSNYRVIDYLSLP